MKKQNVVKNISSLVFKALVVTLLTSPFFVKAESVSLGYFTLVPHIFQDKDGNAAGPLAELLNKHIGPAMGVTFKLVNMPLARILKEMEKGKLAGAAIFGYTPKRAEKYTYPVHSFSSMQSVIAVLKSNPISETSLTINLKKLSIGYVGDAIVSPYMKYHQIKFLNISGKNVWERNIKMLINGRLDAVYSPNKINMIHAVSSVSVLDKINIIRLPEAPLKLYSLFSNGKNFVNLNLSARYDKAFTQINGAQVYKSLLEQQVSLPIGEGKLGSQTLFKSKVEQK
jgi:hypothetical protein